MSTTDSDGRETLRDGRRVRVRPITPTDVERNAAFLEALSPPSRHFLFLGGVGHLGEADLRRLCDVDQASDVAFVALDDARAANGAQRQVAVARYAGAGAAGAEISVAVADDWQHAGLGTLMLRRLIAHAREHGVSKLYSIDAAANERMRRLARSLGFAERRDPDDAHQVIYSLALHR